MAAKKPVPKVADQIIEELSEKPEKLEPVASKSVKSEDKAKIITVRAVLPDSQIGFIGDRGGSLHHRRRDGDVFEILEHQFSKNWMERVEE